MGSIATYRSLSPKYRYLSILPINIQLHFFSGSNEVKIDVFIPLDAQRNVLSSDTFEFHFLSSPKQFIFKKQKIVPRYVTLPY